MQPQPLPDNLPASSRIVGNNARVYVNAQEAVGISRCAIKATAADKEGRAREERKVARLIASSTGNRLAARGAVAPIEVFFHILCTTLMA